MVGKRPSFLEASDTPKKKQKVDPMDKERDVKIQRYVESRAVEIQALTEQVKHTSTPSVFLSMPRHMRRRAMSHNIKRVPKRLHHLVITEILKHNKTTKRPSRKYRRKPSNLLNEYERRKQRVSWLETHIWHAKRFHMVEKWGYRLALHPTDKSIRSCYRAVSHHCMMQDVSFENYIEIVGPQKNILSGLIHLSSESTGPTFASKMTFNGTRQGQAIIYCYDSYPYGCIGEVTFLWKPNENSVDDSTLWICCHAAIFSQTLSEINKCFDKRYENQANQVKISSLKNKIAKIRFYGPATHSILQEVLKPAITNLSGKTIKQTNVNELKGDIHDTGKENLRKFDDANVQIKDNDKTSSGKEKRDSSESKNLPKDKEDKSWWTEWCSKPGAQDQQQQTLEAWGRLSQHRTANECPSSCVIGLSVRDPRLLLPPKKKRLPTTKSGSSQPGTGPVSPAVSTSPLWEASVRSEVKETKLTEAQLNALKAKQLIPGSPLELGEQESTIPVLLIQRPGAVGTHTQTGYSGGWDLLLPAGWVMAFWVACVYRGARVGGLREESSTNHIATRSTFPEDFPDTSAGEVELTSSLDELRTKHLRRPPAKRPNYTKLGIPSPFNFKGSSVANYWAREIIKSESIDENEITDHIAKDNESQNIVLRDRKVLRLVDSLLKSNSISTRNNKKTENDKDYVQSFLDSLHSILSGQRLLLTFFETQVHISFQMLRRGTPFFRGHICMPSEEDLKSLKEDKEFYGPLETPHKDPYKAVNKEEKEKIAKFKKRLKKEKNGNKNKFEQNIKTSSVDLEVIKKSKQNMLMKKGLSTQESDEYVNWMNICDRAIIGFVRKGSFDLSKGKGSGIGLCSVSGLLLLAKLQKKSKCLVLIRNPTSLQYRFASLNVII